MAMPAVAWQILFFYIPVALIILLSFVKTVQVHLGNSDFYLRTLCHIFSAIIFLGYCCAHLLLALVTAFICLFLAYPVAYCFGSKSRTAIKIFFLFFLILPFWTSLMVQVYSWFFVLEHNGLLNTIFMQLGLISATIAYAQYYVCHLFGDGILLFAIYDYALVYGA